ncbi:class I SAM-dependent methyltransferase [Amycolatopsis aidingensis]|uniref:class I SAM-dependent methyltransferase n=1 Tax=Amycolatopsis aidingensis TaxID=2842453 RepID=UPI001C0B009F|nr:class I SAM-dependent methyltransferase [Amycolatopsis aidingensis]
MAESFGTDPDRYDRARPRYPEAMVRWLLEVSPGTDLLDVGCGTGISLRPFQRAGRRVLGVEPDARMAGYARRHGAEVEVATFEDWEDAGRRFDTVLAGQAWHWVDPVAGAAKAARVLRPGGRLAVFWNADQPPPELARAFAEVYRRVLPDSPAAARWQATGVDGYARLCDRAADGIAQTGAFTEPERRRFDWERSYTREEWLEQLSTSGGHGRFPEARLAEVLAGIGAAVDDRGGSFPMRYTTLVVSAVRTGNR